MARTQRSTDWIGSRACAVSLFGGRVEILMVDFIPTTNLCSVPEGVMWPFVLIWALRVTLLYFVTTYRACCGMVIPKNCCLRGAKDKSGCCFIHLH